MVVSDKNPAGWMPGPSPLGLLSGTGLSGHQGRVARQGLHPWAQLRTPCRGAHRPPALLHPARPGPTVPCLPRAPLPRATPSPPRTLCPCRFPLGGGNDLLRKRGPGQQAAWEQPRPAPPHPVPPRPALPRVQSCHGLWVSVGCPGLGGGWGPGGGAAPPPQIPPWPEPLQAVPLACGCP